MMVKQALDFWIPKRIDCRRNASWTAFTRSVVRLPIQRNRFVDLVGPHEKKLLNEFNPILAANPSTKTIHEVFAEQADRILTGNRPGFSWSTCQLSGIEPTVDSNC